MHIKYSEKKLAELALYVAGRMQDSRTFGATVLNKVLYYSDFLRFAETGAPITGAQYMRLQNGPVPHQMLPVIRRLELSGRARVDTTRRLGRFPQKRLIPLSKPDIDLFDAEEIALVDEVIALFRDATATVASEVSHTALGWKVAEHRGEIPYHSVWLKAEPLTPSDMAKARELATELASV